MTRIPYHHENLKTEMLKKGLQLLNEAGYEGFSLRKLAASCNVSHAAPYRHFKNKEDLIEAICKDISDDMMNTILEVTNRFRDDPRARLMEISKAFVRLMVENPDYFRFVFMTKHERMIAFTGDKIVFEAKEHPFGFYKYCAQEYLEKLCGNHWMEVFLEIWSLIQGFTLLLVNETIEYKGDYLSFTNKMLSSIFERIESRYPLESVDEAQS